MRQSVFMLVIHWATKHDLPIRFVGIKISLNHNGLFRPMTPANKVLQWMAGTLSVRKHYSNLEFILSVVLVLASHH